MSLMIIYETPPILEPEDLHRAHVSTEGFGKLDVPSLGLKIRMPAHDNRPQYIQEIRSRLMRLGVHRDLHMPATVKKTEGTYDDFLRALKEGGIGLPTEVDEQIETVLAEQVEKEWHIRIQRAKRLGNFASWHKLFAVVSSPTDEERERLFTGQIMDFAVLRQGSLMRVEPVVESVEGKVGRLPLSALYDTPYEPYDTID